MAAIVIIYTLNLDSEISPLKLKKKSNQQKVCILQEIGKKALLVTVRGQEDPPTARLRVSVNDGRKNDSERRVLNHEAQCRLCRVGDSPAKSTQERDF